METREFFLYFGLCGAKLAWNRSVETVIHCWFSAVLQSFNEVYQREFCFVCALRSAYFFLKTTV